MVLEKNRLEGKQLNSEEAPSNEIEDIGGDMVVSQQVQGAVQPNGFSPTGKTNGKIVFQASGKKKIQLSFQNVVIQTIPQQRKCCNRKAEVEKPKVILNDVSGSIIPGQFLAIIGASGKSLILLKNHLFLICP